MTSENDLAEDAFLQAGDFTDMPNEVIQHIIKYLYEPLYPDCVIENFYGQTFQDQLHRLHYNKKGLGRLNMACKKFNLLDKPWVLENRMLLNHLLFESLSHSNNINDIIELCIDGCVNASSIIVPKTTRLFLVTL